MATRGAIARLTSTDPLCFAGVYHHWDSYPEGLGKTLWELYHIAFGQDLDALLKAIIDDHPAGWSSLHSSTFDIVKKADGEKAEGQKDDVAETSSDERASNTELKMRNELARLVGANEPFADLNCYCHGERHEDGWEVNERNAAGSGIEYVYAFSGGAQSDELPSGEDQNKAELKGKPTMFVLSSYRPSGAKMIGFFGFGDENARWRVIAQVDLSGQEPDWKAITEGFAVPPLQ